MQKTNLSIFAIALALLFSVGLTSCSDDDDDDAGTANPLIGNWLSEGSNVAPLLANPPLNVVSVTAEFNDNNTYTVVSTDTNNAQITFTGTYTLTPSGTGDIFNITLQQSAPTAVTSEGIFQISGNTLTYEVAQTVPSIAGVTPPTAAAGFGSTSGGALGNANVQTFVKQ